MHRIGILQILLPVCLAFIGCQSYEGQIREIKVACVEGRLQHAVEAVSKQAENASSTDQLVWQMEAATLQRASGDIAKSQRSFEQADQKYEDALAKARILISKEALSLVTNPTHIPYRGTLSEGIMLSVYQALNALEAQDLQNARVQLTRSYLRQQEAVDINSERIDKTRKAEAKSANKAVIQNSQQSAQTQLGQAQLLADLPDTTGYENYVNPFAVYLDGLFHLYHAVDDSDRERARKTLARAAALAPYNHAIATDASFAQSHQPLPPALYVIFETGLAPSRTQFRIDIPILISRVSYVGISFPRLVMNEAYIPTLSITSPDSVQPLQTEVVCDMDKVIAQEFKNDLPGILTRAIASATTKAIASYAINRACDQQDAFIGLASQLITAGYQIAMNVADTRSWNALPKQFQVCKIPIPASRHIQIATGRTTTPVDIMPGEAVVLYIRSFSPQTGLLIRQFKLK